LSYTAQRCIPTALPRWARHIELSALLTGKDMMSIDKTSSEDSSFGCECALPFLTRLHADALGRAALSSMALGAAVALGGCDRAANEPPKTVPADKAGSVFEKIDRELARAKARWRGDDARARRSADAASAAR
jgi:hypothetical protein